MHARVLTYLALLIAVSPQGRGVKDGFDVTSLLHRRVDALEDMVHRRADEVTTGALVARMPELAPQAPGQSTAANLTGSDPSNINQAALDATISTACNDALASIETAWNPAGFLACYNVPFLNTVTGVFSADLRLYQIQRPSADFAGVKATDVSVQLSYPNAAFSEIPQDTPRVERRLDLKARQDSGTLTELQNYLFVGQVVRSLSLTKLEDLDLMALLIPSIQLAADKSNGSRVTTDMTSTSMVFFVCGVFEGQGASGASAAVPSAATAAAAKAAAFELPGTTLGVFPTGLIITSIWAMLFLGAVGYGTWGRIQFRAQFRQRKERALVAGMG